MQNPHEVIVREFRELLELSRARFPTFTGTEANLEPILMRYAEPWRYFHTAEHIADCFRKLRSVYQSVSDPFTIWWALLYHDAVLVPTAVQWNEYCSAELAKQELIVMGVPVAYAELVGECVYATWDHLVPERYTRDIHDLMLMLDVDLSGLAAPRSAFEAAGEQLRKEYSLVSDMDFKRGRARFCQSMLLRKNIFQSEEFSYLETVARENLTWAVEQAVSVVPS